MSARARLVRFVLVAAALALPAAALAETPRLWQDPGDVARRDVVWGPGSAERQPKPPFKFVKENTGGTASKIVVADADGTIWDVKLGVEAYAELVAGRFAHALGFLTQDMYFLPGGTVQGVPVAFERAGKYVKPDGTFTAARFRQRSDPTFVEVGKWSFDKNPFVGTRELSGLVLLMALLNNWDTELDRNMRVYRVKTPSGTTEDWYVVKDVGASFGRYVGPQGTPIKWHLPSYEKEPFNPRVEGDMLVFNYPAFGKPPDRVPLEHARWFVSLVSQMTPEQVRAAFAAGGATPREIEGYSARLLAKIAELRAAVAAAPAGPSS